MSKTAEYRVLVVEDDRNMRELLVETLEDEGYLARGADSVAEARVILRRHHIHLVVSDVRMAGLDGVAGVALFKKDRPDLKCIIITGYADNKVPARAIEVRVDDYLYKPFRLDEFLTVVSRVRSSNSLVAHYHKLLSGLTRGPRDFLRSAWDAVKKEQVKAVLKARWEAYKGLYVAIRSDLISCHTANGMFLKLVRAEEQYKQFLAQPSRETGKTLHSVYGDFCELLTTLDEKKVLLIGDQRLPGPEFRRFFSAVQNGQIKPEQLQLASALRLATAEELSGSPELHQLRQVMWG